MDEKMYECEVKIKMVTATKGRYNLRWLTKPVYNYIGVTDAKIRCKDCHGAIRLHGTTQPDAPAPHAEHRSRRDSEYCRAGQHFREANKTDDQHRLSENPVQ